MMLLSTSDRTASFYMLGYILSRSLTVIGFIVGTSTTFLLLSPAYKAIYKTGGSLVLYIICVLTVLFYCIRLYSREISK